MKYYMHKCLSTVGWWLSRLPYVDEAVSGVGLPFASTDTDTERLVKVGVYADTLDRTLGHCPSTNNLQPAKVREMRWPGFALRKWRKLRSPEYSTEAVKRFISSQERCQQSLPKYLLPYIRARLARLTKDFGPCLGECGSRFGPGAVKEGIPTWFRWTNWSDVKAGVLFRDPCTLCLGPGSLDPELSYSRLCAVPKNWKSDRLITIEPKELTRIQHPIRWALSCAFLDSGLDPASLRRDNQVYHRGLARKGSLDGSLATFDMTDASDLIGYGQICEAYPADVMAYLDVCRVSSFSYKTEEGDALHAMRCYAGMGNATTFPVMTGLFWAVCHGVADYHRLGRRFVSVHGDDIVTDARLAELLVRTQVFEACGWVLNLAKSMWSPDTRYRESCGEFAFRGESVAVPRIYGYEMSSADEFPADLVSLLDLIRNPAMDVGLVDEIVGLIDADIPNIPHDVPGSVSISCPWRPWSRIPTRYDQDTQQLQYRLQGSVGVNVVVPATLHGHMLARLVGQFEYRELTKHGTTPSRQEPQPATQAAKLCRGFGSKRKALSYQPSVDTWPYGSYAQLPLGYFDSTPVSRHVTYHCPGHASVLAAIPHRARLKTCWFTARAPRGVSGEQGNRGG